MSDEPNRRRHARAPALVEVALAMGGAPIPVARVIDASIGGAFLEVRGEPPALWSRCRCTVKRGDIVLERDARVVRIRWGGRDRGAPIGPAVALVFDEVDAESTARLEALLVNA
jgi:hypothetical protein